MDGEIFILFEDNILKVFVNRLLFVKMVVVLLNFLWVEGWFCLRLLLFIVGRLL